MILGGRVPFDMNVKVLGVDFGYRDGASKDAIWTPFLEGPGKQHWNMLYEK